MEIQFPEDDKSILKIAHRNSAIACPTSGYNRKNIDVPAAFQPLNEYWSVQPMVLQDAYFALYQDTVAVIDGGYAYLDVKARLTDIGRQMFDLIDYPKLTEWVHRHGRIAYDANIHKEYPADYEQRRTYLENDYNELVVLSFYFKMMAPIWSLFSDTPSTLDTGFKEINALELMDTSRVHQLPAMERLKDFCEALAEDESKNKGLTPAIVSKNIGSNEMPKYFLALAIVRRISIGEIRNPNNTLIKIAFKFLRSIIKNLKAGCHDKRRFNNDSDDPDSIAERYRISQEIPDYAIAVEEAYIDEIERLVKDNDPEANVKKALQYHKVISESVRFSIAPYHLVLCAAAMDTVVFGQSGCLEESATLRILIPAAAAWYSDKGFQDIANLMLAPHMERDLDAIDMSMASGFAFASLTKVNRDALEAIYPNQQMELQGKSRGLPGVDTIEAIIEMINQYQWDDGVRLPQNFRNDFAQVLLIREERLAQCSQMK